MQENIAGKASIVKLDYPTFLEQVINIKYFFRDRTGYTPNRILLSEETAKQIGIQDIVEILGLKIVMSKEVSHNKLKVGVLKKV